MPTMPQTEVTMNEAPTSLTMPSVDQVSTLDELIRQRAIELGDAPLLAYPRKDSLCDYEVYSASQIDAYVDAAVQALLQRGLEAANRQLEQAPTIGILAHSGLHFIITLLALSRLGYAVLLLSTRLAAPAAVRLLALTDCETLLTTDRFATLIAEIRAERILSTIEMLAHEGYSGCTQSILRHEQRYDPESERSKRAVIIHSSGSTGLPKPIYLTHESCLAAFALNLNRRSLMTQPLFHSFGFYETFRAVFSGKPMYYYNYDFPITKQNLMQTIEAAKPDLFFCVPYILKLLGDDTASVKLLSAIDLILFGGSACPDELGDHLTKQGVNIAANYGATETGRMMTSERPGGDPLWNYLRILPQTEAHVLMDEISPGIFEAVALESLKSRSTVNSDSPPNSFRTKDLFVKHPTIPNRWKFISRLDDRLTLYNGEKVLPIPIEGHVRRHPLVKEAVVFGDGRTIPGLLLIKADEATDTHDNEYLQAILPTVEAANANAESFSRIPPELIVFLPADAAYPRTDKGTFIRAQVYGQYASIIESAYEAFENTGDANAQKLILSQDELRNYLQRLFKSALHVDLATDADFFAAGIDSLMCMRVWTLLKRDLDLGGNEGTLSQNVLYETGNVDGLAQHLFALRIGSGTTLDSTEQVMTDLINKYSTFEDIRTSPDTIRVLNSEVIVLTGVTGGLGAHILNRLLQLDHVTSVWAMIRASSDEAAHDRMLKSLSERGITLCKEHLSKVVAVAADLSKSDFGLGSRRWDRLRSQVTCVIHSAWAVNFNLAVQSFEDQHIKAVRTFIDLCQNTTHDQQARFYFCSSVSSTGATPRPDAVPEAPVRHVSHVQNTGYAQSKYVAEQIVRNAATAGAQAYVLRIGQLSADTAIGEWNTTEGVPLMIQTATIFGCLPGLDDVMTWLPIDVAGNTIVDIVESGVPADPEVVYHIVHPQSFHWSKEMLPALALAGLKFDTVPTEQWMNRLRQSSRDPTLNPPIKLLGWFESKYGDAAAVKPKGLLEYDTRATTALSAVLASAPKVTGVQYTARFIARLKGHWNDSTT